MDEVARECGGPETRLSRDLLVPDLSRSLKWLVNATRLDT
jgi:hypothetical protein